MTSNTSDGVRDDKYSPRNIKQVADTPRSLQVEVLSSKSKVSVTIDGTTVSSWPGYRVSSESGEEGDGEGGIKMEAREICRKMEQKKEGRKEGEGAREMDLHRMTEREREREI